LGAWYYCRNCEGEHPGEHLLKKMRVRGTIHPSVRACMQVRERFLMMRVCVCACVCDSEADLAFERCALRTDIRPITCKAPRPCACACVHALTPMLMCGPHTCVHLVTTNDDQECFLCHKEIHGPCYARRLSMDEFGYT
jgi:hypothetical protein